MSGLVEESGAILAQDYRPTKAKRGPEAVVQRAIESAAKVMQDGRVSAAQLHAIGIGAPGPVDPSEGVVVSPPNLPGWGRLPLRDLIQSAFGVQTFIENDANAAALAENRFGAGRGSDHMAYVTVSTGIGGGFILDGRLYTGLNGAAAEIGHMTVLPHGPHCGCGNRGCLEAVASGTAIAREGRELMATSTPTLISDLAGGNPELVTAKLVAEAAARGDVAAQEIIGEAVAYLGIGMANLVNLLNPEVLVIGGSLTKLGDLLFEAVRRAIARRAFPAAARRVRVVPAGLGDAVVVLGAVAVAMMRADQTNS